MRAYWPRMSLDGSQFLWLSDITQFDIWVVVVTAASVVVIPLLSGQTRLQARVSGQSVIALVISGAVFCAIVAAMAAYWGWPAYVFIFFLLQGILGTITQFLCGAIGRLAS